MIKKRINYLLAALTLAASVAPVALAQSAQDIPAKTSGQLETLVSFIVVQIPVWIAGIIVIALSFVIAKIIQNSVENKLSQSGFEEEHKEMQVVIGRVVHIGVIILGVTVGLKIAGLDLTPIIAAGAFGAGFALQDLITNFLAGVMILSSRHFTIGDNIVINGVKGKIIDIQTRATIVKKFDGTKVVIPNAELFKNPVTSLTSNPFRRAQIAVGVEYGSDLKQAMACCLKAAKESTNVVLDPKPSVWLVEFGGSSINLKVNAWFESRNGIIKTKTNLVYNIKKELNAAGIGIPFPIRTIVFDEDDRKRKEEAEQESAKEGAGSESGKTANKVAATEAAPAKSPASPEHFDAPDWLKKTAQAMAAPAVQPAPALAAVTVAASVPMQTVEPAMNPLYYSPPAFEAPAPTQMVAQPAPVMQPAPVQMPATEVQSAAPAMPQAPAEIASQQQMPPPAQT